MYKYVFGSVVLGVIVFVGVVRWNVEAGGDPEPALPLALEKGFLDTVRLVVDADTKQVWYDWGSAGIVVITRRERPAPEDPWGEAVKQAITTSFRISDVLPVCEGENLSKLYVSGLYDDGRSVMERWSFSSAGGGSGGFSAVAKKVVYSGTTIGVIASFDLNEDESWAFVVTYDTDRLYKLSTSGISSPILLHDAASIPELADARTIQRRRHLSEGTKYLVSSLSRWKRPNGPVDPNRKSIVFHDADENGVFESHEVISMSEFSARSYDFAPTWVPRLCQ